MSKKSRKRNKKILATIAALGGAAMLANRRRNNMINSADANDGFVDTEFKIQDVAPKTSKVNTATTVMDSMPPLVKKNPLSKRIKKNTNKVYTIKGVKEGKMPVVGNEKSIFKGDDGYLRRGEDAIPMTTGRFGTFKADQEMKKGMLPPQLRVPKISTPRSYNQISAFAAKDGGRAKLKSGGRVKGAGCAKRGFGKAFKGGKK
jgi:hypothetical protein